MSKRALELLETDAAPADEQPTERPRLRAIAALEASPETRAVMNAPPQGPPVPEPWWKQGFETKPDALMTHPRDLARLAVGAADLANVGMTGIGNQLAGTLAGIAGAISPTDTYVAARNRERDSQRGNEPQTGGGRELAGMIGQAAEITGIPQVVGPVAEAARERFPASADLATTALMLAPSTRLLRGVPEGRPILGPSGEVVGRQPAMAPPSIALGEAAGAAGRSVDLATVRSPQLRQALAEASAKGTLNPEIASRAIEADALGVPLTKGQLTGDPVQISWERNIRAKHPELADLYARQNEALTARLDEVRRDVAPNVATMDAAQNGQTLVDAYKARDALVREDIKAKYLALRDAAGGDFPVDGQAFVAGADAALKRELKTRWLPAEIAGDLADFRDGSRTMTFGDFESLRTALAAAGRSAERAGDGNRAAAINLVREQLEALPLEGHVAETLKPLADAARNAAAARFARLREDPAYRAAVDDPTPVGEASPLADDFVAKYVVRGRGANITRMRENLSGDPLALETISAGALNYLRGKSGINAYTGEGTFSAAGYNRALAELAPRMRELLPGETADRLTSLGNVARAIEFQPRGSFVNTSNTATALMAEGAQSVVDNVAAAHGLPLGPLRSYAERRAERRLVEEAMRPGSGVDYRPRRLSEVLRSDDEP